MSETPLLQELTYDEAAAILGINGSRLRALVRDGKGPKCRRHGRSVTFLRSHLEEWVEEYSKSAYTKKDGKPKARKRKEHDLTELV